MNRYSKFLLLGMIFAALVALVVPVAAQDGVGAGEGGTIIESNFGGDASTFNPIISSDAVSSDVHSWFYPNIIGNDDVTLQPTPNVPRALAASWEYDESGTVLTVTLREDMFWSNGEQMTADDWIWAVNAVKSGQTSSPRTSALFQLDDGTIAEGPIHSVTKIDDFTIEVRLGNVTRDEEGNVVVDEAGNAVLTPNCDAINSLNDISVVPSSIYEAAFGTDYAAMDADPYFVPQDAEGNFVTYGPFTDPFIEFGVQVSLLADETYTEGTAGFVRPSEWLYQNVEDSTVEYERFLAGDYSYLEVAPNNQNAFRELEGFQTIEYPQNGFTYLGFNLADPNNPQSGRDADGNLIDQGLHPVFGDKLVRQAIAYAINVEEMIGTRPEGDQPATGILEGNGYPIATTNHPGLSSTSDELEALGVAPYPYDPARAEELLTEAGWVDSDDNGIRECQGCLYATEVDPAYEGTELQFELITNAGNAIREATGETIRAQLAEVGFVVNFQAIEFATMLDEMDAQTFDSLIIGWRLALPFTPGDTMLAFHGIGQDIVGSGFNANSYANEEFDAMIQAADSLPGCNQDERDQMYAEAQKIISEDLPYVWLFAYNTMIAAQGNIVGWDPLPYNATWNLDSWSVENR
jgi:peptide/nickel transport system substrate-binding protein